MVGQSVRGHRSRHRLSHVDLLEERDECIDAICDHLEDEQAVMPRDTCAPKEIQIPCLVAEWVTKTATAKCRLDANGFRGPTPMICTDGDARRLEWGAIKSQARSK